MRIGKAVAVPNPCEGLVTILKLKATPNGEPYVTREAIRNLRKGG